MALVRRRPGGGVPGDSEPITGESQLPGVRDTRAGLGGDPEPESPFGSDSPAPSKSKGYLNPDFSRFGETPRERGEGGGPGGFRPTPASPREPEPMSATPGGGMTPPPPAMAPFQPLMGANPASLVAPAGGSSPARRLYGGARGLTGGGLGMPLDPVSNDASDPISSLIALLQKPRGGFGSF